MKNIVTILWTGGWDSTFRLLCLAENEDISIQPVYVIDENRKSKEYELDAMNKILTMIRMGGYSIFKAEIRDIKTYTVSWIMENCKNEVISNDYRYLHEKYNIGSQYEWLALLCKHENVKMELGLESAGSFSKATTCIYSEGKLKHIENDFLDGRCIVEPKGESQAVLNVFGNFIYSIMDLTKIDEERIAREKGFIDIMKLTWFCHSPIDGQPCGLCNPCNDAIHEGMEWRMPEKAIKRNKHRKFNKFYYLCKEKLFYHKI